jgi:hypothetical protein
MKTRISTRIALILILSIQSCKTFDATVGTDEMCKVHDEKMKVARTWIKYGLRPIKAKIESENFEYPNTKQYHYGGCVIGKGRPRIFKYYYCSVCNKAAKK